MKILATVLMASALMAGCSNFASQRANAIDGNMSQAKNTMQNQAPDMPTRASDGRLIGPNGNTVYTFGRTPMACRTAMASAQPTGHR